MGLSSWYIKLLKVCNTTHQCCYPGLKILLPFYTVYNDTLHIIMTSYIDIYACLYRKPLTLMKFTSHYITFVDQLFHFQQVSILH